MPYCLSSSSKSIEISWGSFNLTTTDTIHYIIKSNRKIVQIKPKERVITKLDEQTFCKLLFRINEAFLKTQVINELGDTLEFMEYKNPTTGFYSRAIWNPKFRTKNSLLFRQLIDSINAYVNQLK